MQDGEDGGFLVRGGEGVEGGGFVGDEAVEDDGEGCHIGGAVVGGHLGEVGVDGGLRAVADDGAKEDVEGGGFEVEVLGLGPVYDGGGEFGFVDVE